MELRQLEQFVAVAEEGQFTRAAVRCVIAQSALSTSIRSLERELGTPLFVRTTRRVALTEAGQAFLTEARLTLAAASAARNAVEKMQISCRGTLAIGGISTFNLLDQAALLRRFCAAHPGVTIRYVRSPSAVLIDDVRHGRLDVAFVSLPPREEVGLRTIELMVLPMMFVCGKDHRFAARYQVGFDEMINESFAGPPFGSPGYETVDRIFAAAGVERTVTYSVNDISTTLDFVEQGLGVTLVVEALVAGRPNLRAIPLTDRSMVWRVGAVFPLEAQTTAAAQALLDMVNWREFAEAMARRYPVAPTRFALDCSGRGLGATVR